MPASESQKTRSQFSFPLNVTVKGLQPPFNVIIKMFKNMFFITSLILNFNFN